MTSSPFARNNAVQLAPMTPVPMIATRPMGFVVDIITSPSDRVSNFRVSNAGEISLRGQEIAFS